MTFQEKSMCHLKKIYFLIWERNDKDASEGIKEKVKGYLEGKI